jgi:hypothetical protein
VNCGFPEDKIERDISVFEGTTVHVNRVPQQARPGLVAAPGAKAKDILVVTKIHQLPGEKAAVGKKAAGKKTAMAPAAVSSGVAAGAGGAGSNGAAHEKAIETVLAILTSKGGTIKKLAIAQEAFKLMQAKNDPHRNEVCQLVFKDDFLGAPGMPWSYTGDVISLG